MSIKLAEYIVNTVYGGENTVQNEYMPGNFKPWFGSTAPSNISIQIGEQLDAGHPYEYKYPVEVYYLSEYDTSLTYIPKTMSFERIGDNLLSITYLNTQYLTDMSRMFANCVNLKECPLETFDTSKVRDMSYMFYKCNSLANVADNAENMLDLSNFNTSRVTNMEGMFKEMSTVPYIDLSSFDTKNVTNMSYMFYGTARLKYLGLETFDVNNVTDMSYMFAIYGAEDESGITLNNSDRQSLLEEIYVNTTKFITGNVTNMECMFAGCHSLKYLNISSFNTAKVTNMRRMFMLCNQTGTLTLANFDFSSVINADSMFEQCKLFSELNWQKADVSNLVSMKRFATGSSLNRVTLCDADLSNLENMEAAFKNATNLNFFEMDDAITPKLTNTRELFSGCSKLASIYIPNIDTSKVTDMMFMFDGCSALTTLSGINTLSTESLTNMSCMFRGCASLTTLDVSIFNTGKVTNMMSTFDGCTSLSSLNISGFDTTNVMYLTGMFNNCSNLKTLDVSNFNTVNVKTMGSLFSGCSSITSLDLSGFVFDNCSDVSQMFASCSSLTSIDLSSRSWGGIISVTNMFKDCTKLATLLLPNNGDKTITNASGMFRNCYKLTSVNDLQYILADKVTLARNMFEKCFALKSIDLTNCNTVNITDMTGMFAHCGATNISGTIDMTNCKYASSMFYCCETSNIDTSKFYGYQLRETDYMFQAALNLTELKFPDNNDFPFLNTAIGMFEDCVGLKTLSIPNFNVKRIHSTAPSATSTDTKMYNMFANCIKLDTVSFDNFKIDNSYAESALGDSRVSYFFSALAMGAPNITKLSFKNFNNPAITSMKAMFKDFKKVVEIDLTNFNTSKVTDMSEMFYGCAKLDKLDLSSFDTSKVTTMESMFNNSGPLTNINISSFDFTNVKSLNKFLYFSDITSFDMSNFDTTSNVTEMTSMFAGCDRLTNISNLDKLNTSGSTNMQMMFWNCSSLESLNLSNFITSNVTNMMSMFARCTRLKNIDVSSFNTDKVTTFATMFGECSSLEELDLSNFRTPKTAIYSKPNYSQMFYKCSNLNKLDISGITGYANSSSNLGQMFDGCAYLEYLDISNFREAGDKLYNSTNIFRNFGHESVSGILNIGMLYMDTETCVLYAEKIWEEVLNVSDRTVCDIRIYVLDADANECRRLFYDDAQPTKKYLKFISYEKKEVWSDIPMINGFSKLVWDEEKREYFNIPMNDYGVPNGIPTPTGVKEKIKMETFGPSMVLRFNDLQKHDYETVKIQVAMNEKIEEESEE